jgi:hypothetical protein
MSYTNLELVKKHVSLDEIPGGTKGDYPVTFIDLDWVNLPGRGLVENSVAIKTLKGNEPVHERVTMADGIIPLTNSRLVRDSMTMASDDSLGRVFVENVDYSVDYSNGTIRRLSGGSIAEGTTVSVWYYFYSIYAEGVDFSINSQYGMVKRLPGGTIQPNQTVLVDYELSANQLNDELISEAVLEANAVIERELDPGRQFGADLALQTAATYLAVSLVCRMAAASDLRFGAYGRQTAPSWLTLAESYREDYRRLVKIFRPQAARMNRPTHS